MNDFKGRVALITGAAHGFGLEFVKQAAQRGMKIAAVDIMEEDLKAVPAIATELGAEDVTLIVSDVSRPTSAKEIVAEVMGKYGQIDLLINNAGVAVFGNVWTVPTIDYDWCIDTNLKAHVYLMHEVIPIMMKQGTHCNIVNVCSAAGTFTTKTAAAYQASKFGALALAETVHYDLLDAKADIHMTVYCPGFIQTNLDHSEEYKPDQYKSDDPYYAGPYFAAMQGACKSLIATGRPIAESGPLVFKAIEEDQFYVITHTQYDEQIQLRCENMLARRNPELVPVNHFGK